MMNDSLCRIIAGELQARAEQVEAAVRLLDEGNTVPFIARYRKEVTGGLDDTQLRNLETRLGYLRELEDRRQAILKSIGEQGRSPLRPGWSRWPSCCGTSPLMTRKPKLPNISTLIKASRTAKLPSMARAIF